MSYFTKSCGIQPPAGDPYGLRENGNATVSGGGGSYGIGPASTSATYNSFSSRPAGTLDSVKVSLKGDAGSLRTCEATITCFEQDEFKSVIGGLGKVGTDLSVSIPGGSYSMRVYAHAWSLDSQQNWKVTIKAMGPGQEIKKLNMLSLASNSGLAAGKTFVTDYDGNNEETAVAGVLDYMMYTLQDDLGQLDTYTFSPPDGSSSPGRYCVIKAPSNYGGGAGGNTGFFTFDRICYFTLGWLVETANKFIKASNPEASLTIGDSTFSEKITRQGGVQRVFSADPTNVLIQSGQSDLDQYAPDKPLIPISEWFWSLLGKPAGLRCDAGHIGSFTTGGTPHNILLSYDLLRRIERDHTRNVKSEDEKMNTKLLGAKKIATLDVESFFGSVCAAVREATGGWIDLILTQDSSLENPNPDLLIVNRNEKPDAATPAIFSTRGGAAGGVRDINVTGDIPQAAAVMAMTGGGGPSPAKAGTAEESKEGNSFNPQLVIDAIHSLANAGFSGEACDSLKNLMRDAVAGQATQQAIGEKTVPYPIKLGITLNGVVGFEFGHAVNIDSLSGTVWGGGDACFCVTEIHHTVTNNDFTTQLNTVFRLL